MFIVKIMLRIVTQGQYQMRYNNLSEQVGYAVFHRALFIHILVSGRLRRLNTAHIIGSTFSISCSMVPWYYLMPFKVSSFFLMQENGVAEKEPSGPPYMEAFLSDRFRYLVSPESKWTLHLKFCKQAIQKDKVALEICYAEFLWYLFNSSCVICDRVHGEWVAHHATTVLAITFVIVIVLCLGLFRLHVETRPEKVILFDQLSLINSFYIKLHIKFLYILNMYICKFW